ncbi:Alpha-mannosyltransferase [Penicillium griseofulvum]|uniref:Alpha-mannosyltransferase n=1 Tax=Penicillium patulum TaxID=5078 RepID=A0A135LHB8_PENPA|nr:Alpha-mannosyltransferase [Penicillium griseofulvum]KXG48362.1 Alpha-mannosyltransferase [Penicillium griseofulvum]
MLLRTSQFIIAVVAGWLIISFLLFRSQAPDPSVQSTSSVNTDTESEHDSISQETPDENSIAEIPKLQEIVEDQPNNTETNTNLEYLEPDLFDASLDYILSIIPNEIYRRELLRPVVGTGEAKLHELGLRTRAYKQFFEAWEDVHLVKSDDNHTYVRDDIVPYLRDKFSEPTFSDALHKYESYRQFLAKFSALLFPWTSPYFADHMSMHASLRHGGRGIVTTAGNGQAHFLLAAIPSFRLLGCDLPVEVMYLGENDLSEDFRTQLEALPGVTTRDLSTLVNDKGWQLNGWAGKPFAILFSSFREVLFIDADSLFFVNPESLFDDEEYVRTGALFFRDRNIIPESKKEWLQQILPKPISPAVQHTRMWTGESAHVQESGVIVVDKWMHFIALLLVCRMNGPDRNGNGGDIVGTYDMVYGDKETFWIGWELTGDTSYAFHSGNCGVMGITKPSTKPNPTNQQPEPTFIGGIAVAPPEIGREMVPDREPDLTICAPQLLHLDREQRPLWFNGWLYENKFASERVLGKFEMYMEEQSGSLVPPAWELEEHNLCCLSNSPAKNFTTEESDWIDTLIGIAKTVDN